MDAAPDTTTELDPPMTIAQFADWLGVEESWVRKRLRLLPGVIIESRQTIRIHAPTYLDGRLKQHPKSSRL